MKNPLVTKQISIMRRLMIFRQGLSTNRKSDTCWLIVSPAIVVAVEEAIKAMKCGDLNRAADVLACKSYVCGKFIRGEPFCEDREHNSRTPSGRRRKCVYSRLDILQHEVSFIIGRMPAGCDGYGIIEGEVVIDRGGFDVQSTDDSPTLRNIKKSHERMLKRAEMRKSLPQSSN